MKGLLLRDFYGILNYGKTFLFMELICVVFSFAMKNNTYAVMMAMIFNVSIIGNSLTGEEKGGWAYLLAMPVNRGHMVLEKYLFSFLMQIGFLAVNMAVGAAATAVYQLEWGELWLMSLTSLIFCFYAEGALLPLCYKYGAEKARYLLIAVYMVPMLLLFLVAFPLAKRFGWELQWPGVMYGAALVAVLAFLFLVGSYYLSRNIFLKKEIQ